MCRDLVCWVILKYTSPVTLGSLPPCSGTPRVRRTPGVPPAPPFQRCWRSERRRDDDDGWRSSGCCGATAVAAAAQSVAQIAARSADASTLAAQAVRAALEQPRTPARGATARRGQLQGGGSCEAGATFEAGATSKRGQLRGVLFCGARIPGVSRAPVAEREAPRSCLSSRALPRRGRCTCLCEWSAERGRAIVSTRPTARRLIASAQPSGSEAQCKAAGRVCRAQGSAASAAL